MEEKTCLTCEFEPIWDRRFQGGVYDVPVGLCRWECDNLPNGIEYLGRKLIRKCDPFRDRICKAWSKKFG